MKPWWLRPTREGASEGEDQPEETESPQIEEEAADSDGKPEARDAAPADGGDNRRGAGNRKAPEKVEEPARAEEPEAPARDDEEEVSAKKTASRSRSRGRSSSKSGRGRSRDGNGSAPEESPSARQRPDRREHLVVSEDLDVQDADAAIRDFIVSMSSERSVDVPRERKIALFCDLENIALGVRDSDDVKKFDIHLILERLLEKGRIIVKKAYCDWERYNEFKRPFHESAMELIDIPQKYYSGKNSADIKMVVDAMDLCYAKEHLDTFVVLSGDSDFSPLVSKLKENNKYVIGVGVKNSTSNLLVDNCDEFIYYEDIWRDRQKAPKLGTLPKKQAEVFGLMIDAMKALIRDNKDILWGSMVKQTMQRKKPSFNEGYYGYSTFSELLEDAQAKGVIKLKKDQRSGSYVVTGFGGSKSM